MRIFLTFFILGLFVGAFYTSQRIALLLSTAPLFIRYVAVILWLLPLVGLILFFIRHRLPFFINKIAYSLGTAWICIMPYTVVVFLIIDIMSILFPPYKIILTNNLFFFCALLLFLCSLFTLGNIRYHHKVKTTYSVQVNKPLNREYKIIALSDLHLGYTIGKKELEQWVHIVNQEKPDLIILVGDIFDSDLTPILQKNFAPALAKFSASLGTYAVLGNHDYHAGDQQVIQFLQKAQITPLRDSIALIDQAFYLIGRDDRSNPYRRSTQELASVLNPALPSVLIDHQPNDLQATQQAKIDVQISGHTHKGQVFPINLLVQTLFECAHGMITKGNSHCIVSSGIGIWGGKFRIGTQSEYVCLALSGTPAKSK